MPTPGQLSCPCVRLRVEGAGQGGSAGLYVLCFVLPDPESHSKKLGLARCLEDDVVTAPGQHRECGGMQVSKCQGPTNNTCALGQQVD